MYILGLTGSIGMGKTTAAAMLRQLGVPVFDADGVVHELMAGGGGAVAAITKKFPGAVADGAVDRAALGRWVFDDREALESLEAILHPLVRKAQNRFLKATAIRKAPLCVLDVPLLFETGGDDNCDAVAVVTAPAFLQRSRVLRRPGMNEERFRAILSRQMSDEEKRQRADFIIQTGIGKAHSLRAIGNIVKVTSGRKGRHWPHQNKYSGRRAGAQDH